MTHSEFTSAYRRGAIKVDIDRAGAARLLSARLLLPFVTMPVLGAGVALALVGWIYTGLAVIALGMALPRLVKRSAPHFLLQQALHDSAAYDELTKSGVIRARSITAKDPEGAKQD